MLWEKFNKQTTNTNNKNQNVFLTDLFQSFFRRPTWPFEIMYFREVPELTKIQVLKTKQKYGPSLSSKIFVDVSKIMFFPF